MVYDYTGAIDKLKANSSKNVLPFQRQKIDYAQLHRVIDLKAIKAPRDVLRGRSVRRMLNKEDDLLVLDRIIRPALERQKREEIKQQ